jgi:hypothetical protein
MGFGPTYRGGGGSIDGLPATTAEDDFIVGSSSIGTWIKRTLADIKSRLGIGAGGAVDPATNGGRLAVTPAYMNTASDSALQLNSTSKKALFGCTADVAYAIDSISAYLTAVGAAGNITCEVFDADSNGDPTGDALFTFTPVASGSSADVWKRLTFGSAFQQYPGRRYCFVFSVANGADISFSYNRQDAGLTSGLVPGCWSKSTTDGGTTWTDLTKDNQPALFNVVVGSTEHHCPKIVYGWTGNKGNKIALYDLNTSAWALHTIPDVGVLYDYNPAFGELQGVFLNNSGPDNTLWVDLFGWPGEPPAPVFRDGIAVNSGDNDDSRVLGLAILVARNGSYYGPIRCESYNGLWNAENQTEQYTYRQPYATPTNKSGLTASVWNKRSENDDYTTKILVGTDTLLDIFAWVWSGSGTIWHAITVDILSLPAPPIVDYRAVYTSNPSWVQKDLKLTEGKVCEGLHSIYALEYSDVTTRYYVWDASFVAVPYIISKYMG